MARKLEVFVVTYQFMLSTGELSAPRVKGVFLTWDAAHDAADKLALASTLYHNIRVHGRDVQK